MCHHLVSIVSENCTCKIDKCKNRLVQKGPILDLVVEKFCKKGYGLKTLKSIAKNTFVCEYAGEIITREIAEKRSKNDDMNYILQIREKFGTDSVHDAWIDPTIIGNIGRYINHSCDPNLRLVPVRVEHFSPKIALVASKDIQPNDELTFDYGYSETKNAKNGTRMCFCNAHNCRKYLPFHFEVEV